MELIADILLVAGALGAGLYCFVLGQRLKRFNNLEKGVGGAVAVLSSQVDELNNTLAAAREASDSSGAALSDLTGKAEAVAQRLELMMASMHDMPEQAVAQADVKPPLPTHEIVEETPKADTKSGEATPSKGVMFIRHERTQNGARE